MKYDFLLPDIGEGLVEGEVVKWHVKEGDSVTENQPLCNVLTDKAEVEIPSPKTGRIARLMARAGEKVKVHGVLVTFELSGDSVPTVPLHSQPAAADKAANGAKFSTDENSTSKGAPAAGASQALPAVRKLAAELHVDLAGVKGSGPGGRITEDDVRRANASASSERAPRPDWATPEEKIPFVGIRRRTAEKMAQSLRAAAQVTHMDEADFTALLALREQMKPLALKRGIKLTFLPFIISALTKALKEFPNLNSTLDEAGGVLIRKRYYNIGIATNAESGLIVFNIKDADQKGVWELAEEVSRLADKARAGKSDIKEISGGTFTITNIGPIGGLFATPIINPPEVAILGVMKIQKRPSVVDGGVYVRDKGNLVLSFDHRVVDGAEAAHFLNLVIKHLENPKTLL